MRVIDESISLHALRFLRARPAGELKHRQWGHLEHRRSGIAIFPLSIGVPIEPSLDVAGPVPEMTPDSNGPWTHAPVAPLIEGGDRDTQPFRHLEGAQQAVGFCHYSIPSRAH